MNRRGFSLIEIIVVIALIALVSTLVLVNMNGIQQNTNEVEIKRFEDKISSAACQYVDRGSGLKLSTNVNCSTDARLTTRDDCKENSGGCFVCLKTLIDEGLIDKDVIDPANNKKVIDEQTAVRIRVKWIDEGDTKKKVCTFEGDDHDGGGGPNPSPSISVDTRKRTVYFDYNGGYGSESSREVAENTAIGTLPTGTRTNYVIDYWYYSTDESKHASASDTIGNSDILLKAHWILSERTLIYNNQGGSGCTNKKSNLGSTWGSLCTPSRTGYNFAGWYTQTSGGKQFKETDPVTDNITVYARWNIATYTLTYDNQGGYGCSTKTANYNSNWGTLCTPSRSGYNFLGWYSGTNGSGSPIYSSSTVTGDRRAYAKWEQYKTVQDAYNQCSPSSNYCYNKIYVQYGGTKFLLYRQHNNSIKAVSVNNFGESSRIPVFCCDTGYCKIAYTGNTDQDGIYGNKKYSVKYKYESLPSNRNSITTNYNFYVDYITTSCYRSGSCSGSSTLAYNPNVKPNQPINKKYLAWDDILVDDGGYGDILVDDSGYGDILVDDSGYGDILVDDSGYGDILVEDVIVADSLDVIWEDVLVSDSGDVLLIDDVIIEENRSRLDNKSLKYSKKKDVYAHYGLLTLEEYKVLYNRSLLPSNMKTLLSTVVKGLAYSKDNYGSEWSFAYGDSENHSSLTGLFVKGRYMYATTPMLAARGNAAIVLPFRPETRITGGAGTEYNPYIIEQ